MLEKPYQRWALILLIILLPVVLAGCWDRNEPENRAFVIATGLDYIEEQKLYEITVQIAEPGIIAQQGEGGNGGDPGGAPMMVVSAKGHTPLHAARELSQHITREPYFGQNRVLILTERLARKGLGPVYDFMERERQTRVIAVPSILEDDISITEFFRTDLPLDPFEAEGMERTMRQSSFERAIFPDRSLINILVTSSLTGRDVLFGRANLDEQTEEDRIEGEKPVIRQTIKFAGAAAIHGDQMQGWFDLREVRGWFWIHGRTQRGLMVVNCPAHDEHPISMEVFESTSSMEPKIDEGGKPGVQLNIEVEARLQDQTCPTPYMFESELTGSLNRRLATAVTNEVKQAIERGQELGTDVFGFGNLFYRRKPREWEHLKENWRDTFRTLPVDVNVSAIVRRTGLIDKPFIRD